MVVLMPEVNLPCRYWLRVGGLPFDVFVHDEQTLRAYVAKDLAERRPVLLHLMAHAVGLGDTFQLAKWQRYARWRLRQGPLPLTEREWMLRRYALMTELEDFADTTGPERRAVEAKLRQLLFVTLCDVRGHWRGEGKWLARWAYMADAGLAAAIEFEELAIVGLHILDRIGGPLVEEWRDEGRRVP
jgi:hypothetical protein